MLSNTHFWLSPHSKVNTMQNIKPTIQNVYVMVPIIQLHSMENKKHKRISLLYLGKSAHCIAFILIWFQKRFPLLLYLKHKPESYTRKKYEFFPTKLKFI